MYYIMEPKSSFLECLTAGQTRQEPLGSWPSERTRPSRVSICWKFRALSFCEYGGEIKMISSAKHCRRDCEPFLSQSFSLDLQGAISHIDRTRSLISENADQPAIWKKHAPRPLRRRGRRETLAQSFRRPLPRRQRVLLNVSVSVSDLEREIEQSPRPAHPKRGSIVRSCRGLRRLERAQPNPSSVLCRVPYLRSKFAPRTLPHSTVVSDLCRRWRHLLRRRRVWHPAGGDGVAEYSEEDHVF